MSVKINKFEIENVKRVKAISLEPNENGLTIIGGKNKQGKTSVLDSIAWALGGNRFKPTNPKREGSNTDPYLKVELNNGLIVERKGKNSDLVVTDPSGERAGQTLLNSFISELAIDLPKFMNQTSKEKAKTLLDLVGIGNKLQELDEEESKLYNLRRSTGQIKERKSKTAEEMAFFPDVPTSLISISELLEEQQEILAKNGRNQELRNKNKEIEQQFKNSSEKISYLKEKLSELEESLQKEIENNKKLKEDLENSNKTVEQLKDESTEEIEESISNIESTNEKIRENQRKAEAQAEADELKNEYDSYTEKINKLREEKINLLNGVDMPLKGLSVEDGELIYNGQQWDNMSSAEQLIVSTSIVKALNPKCGFILMDKLEAFDTEELKKFGNWIEKEKLQVIATRVSNGEECTIIISDGFIEGKEMELKETELEEVKETKTWKKGEF